MCAMRCVVGLVAAAAGHNATLWGAVCFDGEDLMGVGPLMQWRCWFVADDFRQQRG